MKELAPCCWAKALSAELSTSAACHLPLTVLTGRRYPEELAFGRNVQRFLVGEGEETLIFFLRVGFAILMESVLNGGGRSGFV